MGQTGLGCRIKKIAVYLTRTLSEKNIQTKPSLNLNLKQIIKGVIFAFSLLVYFY